MADLTTKYLGLELRSPLVVAASPLSREVDTIRRLADAGAGAIVMYSLFQEQCVPGAWRTNGDPWRALAAESFPVDATEFARTPPAYVDHVSRAVHSVDIPIIASLNVARPDRWVQQASLLEQAGAAAIELDVYTIPVDPSLTAASIEGLYVDTLRSVLDEVAIPVALKLCPYFTALPAFADRLDETGVAGLVLFNRLYQPGIDAELGKLRMSAELSTSADSRLAIQWLAVLNGQLRCSLAANGGFHELADVLGGIMAGADVVAICSALLERGVDYLATLRDELVEWLDIHEHESIDDIRGMMSLVRYKDPADFKRAGYAKVLNRYW